MKWKQFLIPVRNMTAEEARAFMQNQKEGTYTLLDVRQPGEYEASRIPGSRLISIADLPERAGELDPQKPVIAY